MPINTSVLDVHCKICSFSTSGMFVPVAFVTAGLAVGIEGGFGFRIIAASGSSVAGSSAIGRSGVRRKDSHCFS